jgi:hypothetical protein
VTIDSLSDSGRYPTKNVADLLSGTCFMSADAPQQWIRWWFHEKRVCVSQYTIGREE